MNLIFLGPPGAGKGTQAAFVSEAMKVPHISTGDMFRKAIGEGTPTGLKAKSYMDAGQLVPDSVVIDMVKERLAEKDCENGYLLDGFPRTIEQAKALATFSTVDAVVDIDVPDEKLIDRLSGRRVCPACRGTFHITRLADEKKCPDCGGELIQRDDDQPATIANRLKVYHAQTAPLVDFYRAENLLKQVDGAKAPEQVTADILKELGA